MFFSAVFAIVSAMVGAGFASGREIVAFFSRYGPFSWLLILFAALMTGLLIRALLETASYGQDTDSNKWIPVAGRLLMLLMFAAAGGAMTAAAGELCALTLPLFHARVLGGLLTLGAGAVISFKSVRALGMIGKLLIPLMLLAFFFCYSVPSENQYNVPIAVPSFGVALFQLLGYCGLNVTLSAGVIFEAGTQSADTHKLVLSTCLIVGLLLSAGNMALLPHAASMENVTLPVVTLLRRFGKAGFYLSAFLLYLAVFSTLIAILRVMRGFFPGSAQSAGTWAALLCAFSSLLGFDSLVRYAYSSLGWIGLFMILWKKYNRGGTKRKSVSSNGRTLMKEEITR